MEHVTLDVDDAHQPRPLSSSRRCDTSRLLAEIEPRGDIVMTSSRSADGFG